MDFENHIILDQIDTWPQKFIDTVESKKKELKGYLEEEHRIDELARKDVSLRYNRPVNKYERVWNNIIPILENILMDHRIIGFHCTRLTEEEIENILRDGLQPLNKDFAVSRIERIFNNSLISKELRDELIEKEELTDENRAGMVYVFHCTSTLRDEWGLNRLFGFWGGEAIYTYLKKSEELKEIGKSCIVLASIKISELDIYPELSKRMLSFYFEDNYFPHDTDTSLETNVKVVRIIKREEQLFEDLTGIQNWQEKI